MRINLNWFEQFCIQIVYYVTYSIPDFAKIILTPIFYFLLVTMLFFSTFVLIDAFSGFKGLKINIAHTLSHGNYNDSFNGLLESIEEEPNIVNKNEAIRLIHRRLISTSLTILASVLVLGIWTSSIKVMYCKNIVHENTVTLYNYNNNYSKEVNSVLEDMYNGTYDIKQ